MAKRRKSAPGKHVGSHTFGGRKFDCAGKRVRSGKSTKKSPRIFCRRDKPAKARRHHHKKA
jgi:hypothetical protein